MVNWRNRCSCARRAPKADRPARRPAVLALIALLIGPSGCGHAEAPHGEAAPTAPDTPLCAPTDRGYLRARLRGAIDADLDWSGGVPQCRGSVRPGGEGVRLLFKGQDANRQPLLLLFGAGPLHAGESTRNVPVNLTVVREGSGEFFATQGTDKCAFDEVHQEALPEHEGQYLLTARGYCTQPARAVGTAGAVLLSRFDIEAIVDYRP